MESKLNTKVRQGEVIFFSSGEYSDYGYCGNVIFIKDCDLNEAAKRYVEVTVTEPDWQCPDLDAFATWLTAQGYCLPLECREIRLGSYGSFESEFTS